jgi:outer membrane cobalamin receptor
MIIKIFLLARLAFCQETPLDLDSEAVTVYGKRSGASETLLEGAALDSLRQSGNFMEALEKAGGVDAGGLSGAHSQAGVSIRGAGAGHTAVVVDGQKMGSSFDLGSLPAEEVVRIEVLKGPEALAISPGALGGAIVVTTRAPQAGQKPWRLGAAMGNFGTTQAHLSTPDFQAGPGLLGFSAGCYKSAGYADNTDEAAYELAGRSSLSLPGHLLKLRLGYSRRSGGAPFAQSLAAQGNSDFDDDDREDKWAFSGGLSDHAELGAWRLDPALQGQLSQSQRLNLVGADLNAGVAAKNSEENSSYGLRIPASRSFGAGRIELNAEGSRETLLISGDWHARERAALALRGALLLPWNLEASLGAQGAYAGGDDPVFLPSGGLSLRPGRGVEFALSAAAGWRPADLGRRFHPTVPFDPSAPAFFGAGEKGSPGLRPERSANTQASLALQGPLASLKASAFANFISGFQNLQIDPADRYWSYLNLDSARVTGFEAGFKSGDWPVQPQLDYLFADARDGQSGSLIPGRLRQKFSYGLEIPLGKSLGFSAEHQYTERNPIAIDASDEDARQPSVSFWILNLGFKAEIAKGSGVFVKCSNALDQTSVSAGIPMRGRYLEAGGSLEF